jgi:hypothetical protein
VKFKYPFALACLGLAIFAPSSHALNTKPASPPDIFNKLKLIVFEAKTKAGYVDSMEKVRSVVSKFTADELIAAVKSTDLENIEDVKLSIVAETILAKVDFTDPTAEEKLLFVLTSLPAWDGVNGRPLEWWMVDQFGLGGIDLLFTAAKKATSEKAAKSLVASLRRAFEAVKWEFSEEEASLEVMANWYVANRALLAPAPSDSFRVRSMVGPGNSPIKMKK